MFFEIIPSPEEIDEAAGLLIRSFPENRIFAFYGEMGAGKTTLIKALCRQLDVGDVTSSPSFGIIHEYLAQNGEPIYHFDFYRIDELSEVFDIGYEEYLFSGQYCFLEWPEKAEPILPPETLRFSIKILEDGRRELMEMD